MFRDVGSGDRFMPSSRSTTLMPVLSPGDQPGYRRMASDLATFGTMRGQKRTFLTAATRNTTVAVVFA